jgi:hypothetical protein
VPHGDGWILGGIAASGAQSEIEATIGRAAIDALFEDESRAHPSPRYFCKCGFQRTCRQGYLQVRILKGLEWRFSRDLGHFSEVRILKELGAGR